MYQNFISYLYEAQHVSGDTPSIIRSLKLHLQPLVLHTWKVVGRVVAGRWQRPATTRSTTFHVCKTRGCLCSFMLLMMGGVSPETCWASYKYEIKFWYTVASCWIFFYVKCTVKNAAFYDASPQNSICVVDQKSCKAILETVDLKFQVRWTLA